MVYSSVTCKEKIPNVILVKKCLSGFPSAYVRHLLLAATASSVESAGSICDTDAHGNGAQSLWLLMKFIVSLCFYCRLLRIQEPIIFGSCYAWLWSTHHFSDFGFFSPITPTSKETEATIRKNSTSNFLSRLPGQRTAFQYKASQEPTCFLWAFPNQRHCSPDSTKKGMPTPGCHGQNEGWEDASF